VQRGDWLNKIANATGTTLSKLMTANCLTSSTIYAGQKLWVPSLPATPKPTTPPPVIVTFALDPPDEIVLGDCVLLSWVVQGVIEKITLTADSHTLVADAAETGDYSDCPTEAGTRQYVLKAEGPDKNSYKTGEITVIDDSEPPVATFTYACTDLSCTFDGSGSNDPDGTIVSYDWDFGDSKTGSDATTSHTYASSDTYKVSLTVTDDEGDTGTLSQDVTVSGVQNKLPVADFTYACTDLSCTFDGSGSNDPDGTIVSYEWDFGDSKTGSGATASHTYASGGTYKVSLTVTDDEGDTGTLSQDVTVSESTGAESSGLVSFSISITPRTIALMRKQDQPVLM
jgi:PKD repeat protein